MEKHFSKRMILVLRSWRIVQYKFIGTACYEFVGDLIQRNPFNV